MHVGSVPQDADGFEKSWLLLADVYIQVSKLLQNVLRRPISYVKFSNFILVMFPLDVFLQI